MSYHLPYTAPVLEPWRRVAACLGRADVFNLDSRATAADDARAKRICRFCPVTSECLVSALADEGDAPAYARVGVRGARTAAERARSAGATTEVLEDEDPYIEMDRLLRLATMTDKEVALKLGAATVTVHRRRHFLGLPIFRPRGSTPRSVYAASARPVEGGHVEWTSNAKNPSVTVHGRTALVARFAFELGHGRAPAGPVTRTCGHNGCIAWEHLADGVIRSTRTAAAQATAMEAAA